MTRTLAFGSFWSFRVEMSLCWGRLLKETSQIACFARLPRSTKRTCNRNPDNSAPAHQIGAFLSGNPSALYAASAQSRAPTARRTPRIQDWKVGFGNGTPDWRLEAGG